MEWTKEAQEAVSKVPFFVRRRVRKRVEEEAARAGARIVDIGHVESCRRKFIKNMEDEVKGYQVETCFGPSGCPNRAVKDDGLSAAIEERLARRNLKEFLKSRVNGPLKMHHEFRVSISDCPNACSRPQICDLGIIGAVRPGISDEPCSKCLACVDICREGGITVPDEGDAPVIDHDRCVLCGQCVDACPTGTLSRGAEGYRFLVGGKLGRHPRLARELPGLRSLDEVVEHLEICLDHFMKYNTGGERFGTVLERAPIHIPDPRDVRGDEAD